MSSGIDAQIFDRGYRTYDGPRAGVGSAMVSVFVSSVQRALGLRRKFRYKVVPIITIVLAYVPALVFMGIAILLPEEIAGELVAEYAGYYGFLTLSVVLFTAFVAPELLSSDRRTGMLGLYLASPLTRGHYLLAKAGALVSVLLLVTFVPLLFLLVGYSVNGLGPAGVVETLSLLGRMAAGGLILSVYVALIGMAAATLTSRFGFAAAGVVMTLVASGVLSGVLVEQADAPDWVQLLWLGGVPFDVTARVFDEPGEQLEGVTTLASVGMWTGVCVACAATVWWGYRRLQVTK